MKDLVLYIVKSIVSNPDAVVVNEEAIDREVRLELQVAPEDMGIIIGKAGQNIKAIRKLLTVRAMADNVRVYLQLIEPEGEEVKLEEAPSEE
jgi:uncharacterized protein